MNLQVSLQEEEQKKIRQFLCLHKVNSTVLFVMQVNTIQVILIIAELHNI